MTIPISLNHFDVIIKKQSFPFSCEIYSVGVSILAFLSKVNIYVLHDLIPLVQFKKRENIHWGVLRFLDFTDGTKSRKAFCIKTLSSLSPKQTFLRRNPPLRWTLPAHNMLLLPRLTYFDNSPLTFPGPISDVEGKLTEILVFILLSGAFGAFL